MSNATRGVARERQVRHRLEREGWAVARGAGSHGCADLWCGRDGTFRHIQVKSDRNSPWANFRPKERQELSALAAQTGGVAELAWWPPRGKCEFLTEDQWP